MQNPEDLQHYFDAEHYAREYQDVITAGEDPFTHYTSSGWREGRTPNSWFDPGKWRALHPELTGEDSDPFVHFLGTWSPDKGEPQAYFQEAVTQDRPDDRGYLAEAFDPAFYLSRYPDLLRARVDPLQHFLTSGWREGRKPNSWFDAEQWMAKHPGVDWSAVNPLVHFVKWRDHAESDVEQAVKLQQSNASFFSLGLSWPGETGAKPAIVSLTQPQPADLKLMKAHFDAEYYLRMNPDVAATNIDPLIHFATIGWIENRDPGPDFSVSYYLRHNRDIREQPNNPYIHFLKFGRKEAWRRWATVADARILNTFDDDDAMRTRVAEAKALEPMVAIPHNQPNRVTSPLINNTEHARVAEALRSALSGDRFKYVIALPHIRMSGASRVGSIFSAALAKVQDPKDILVITTDGADVEYADWFPEEMQRFELSQHLQRLGPEEKSRLLIDLLRGIGCKTLVNVNSRLVWDSLQLFGRQMSAEFNIVTYLFTWDETPKGDRVGYPIQWLRSTAEHHHVLLTDTKALARNITERLGFDTVPQGTSVIPVYTPAGQTQAMAAPGQSPDDARRFLWAGRFDAQKRVDILVDLARAATEMSFDVYGKTVISKTDLSSFKPPKNIKPMGTYMDLQEVLDVPYAGFLYTSQWDGMPTIILDMAMAGLPIIAPAVGGLPEILDNQTGWLIDDFTDVAAYHAALKDIASDPEGARARARLLKERVAETFTDETYQSAIQQMIDTHDL